MRRIVTVVLIAVFLVASTAPATHAGGHGHGLGRGVIGLAAFAIFAPFIIVGEVLAHTVPRVVVAPAPVYYSPQAYAAPASTQPRVIQYPHGRYVLEGDGAVTPYKWVWIPNPPIPPPPVGAPPAPPA